MVDDDVADDGVDGNDVDDGDHDDDDDDAYVHFVLSAKAPCLAHPLDFLSPFLR